MCHCKSKDGGHCSIRRPLDKAAEYRRYVTYRRRASFGPLSHYHLFRLDVEYRVNLTGTDHICVQSTSALLRPFLHVHEPGLY